MLPLQQLSAPDPSHSKSTPGRGTGSGGGDAPFPVTTLSVTSAPSGSGSMSAKASGGKPARAPSSSVLPTPMPTKLLPRRTELFFTCVASAPTTRMPEPCGTAAASSPGPAKFARLLSFTLFPATMMPALTLRSRPGSRTINMPAVLS